ncbi:hypothetical protein D3C72_1576880 [compost metagenome]
MHLGAQLARAAQVAEGQLARVDADAFGLMHGARGFLVVDILAPHGVGVHDPCVVLEDFAQELGFLLQRRHHLGAVRDIQVAAGLRVAVDVFDQALEGLHAVADFLMQAQRGIQAVALDPLRALEPPGRALRLAAVARAAAPADAVGFEHGGLDAVLLGQEDRAGQAGEARADDGHVDVDVMRDRAVVGGRLAGRADPVGGRVGIAVAGALGHQRIVGGIVRRAGRGAATQYARWSIDRFVHGHSW